MATVMPGKISLSEGVSKSNLDSLLGRRARLSKGAPSLEVWEFDGNVVGVQMSAQ